MLRPIDANALMRDIEQYHLSDGKFQHWVEVQPTIDAEPVRHGKWKCTYLPNGFLLEQTCSECGLTFEEPSGHDYDYCPRCGCRMDEE